MRVRLLTVVLAFAAMILLVGMVTAQEAAKPAEAPRRQNIPISALKNAKCAT